MTDDIIDQSTGTGLVLGNTLSVIGTGPGFMEGCFHFFSPHGAQWNDTKGHQLMSTGTEDYYNNGFCESPEHSAENMLSTC